MCALKSGRRKTLTREDAETLALRALAFLAEDPGRLGRFLALTGLDPDGLRTAADTAPVQAAALDYLLGEESLLLVFAGHAGTDPETIPAARALLEADAGDGSRR